MKRLETILKKYVQMLNESREQVQSGMKSCNDCPKMRSCNHCSVRCLESAVKTVQQLLPYKEELAKILGENEILSIGSIIGDRIYIQIRSRTKIGAYDYKYFLIDNGKLELVFEGGNFEIFYFTYLRPRDEMRKNWEGEK